MERDLRDPEQIGLRILAKANPVVSACKAADRVLALPIPEYDRQESTVTYTQQRYKEELIAQAQTDVNARDLAVQKGWLPERQCFTHTRDGLQRCILEDGHVTDHKFPDGTRHV